MEENTVIESGIKFSDIEIWDNSKRAKNLLIVFWIVIALTIIGIISGYFELELLKSAQMGNYVDEKAATANDLRQGIIGIIQFVAYITSVVLFLMWFRRAYGNLHRVGLTYLKYNEPMAIWAWFIPIISLFRPVQIMNEIWTETQDQIKKYDTSYNVKNGALLIAFWWILFIISNIFGRYILKSAFKSNTIEELIESSQAMLISDIFQVVEALLVILIVYNVSKMEKKLLSEVANFGGDVFYNK